MFISTSRGRAWLENGTTRPPLPYILQRRPRNLPLSCRHTFTHQTTTSFLTICWRSRKDASNRPSPGTPQTGLHPCTRQKRPFRGSRTALNEEGMRDQPQHAWTKCGVLRCREKVGTGWQKLGCRAARACCTCVWLNILLGFL
jgi:hypothetical protein